MVSHNTTRDTDFDVIRRVIEEEGLKGEKLTAREILEIVNDKGADISSSHKVATILGYHSESPHVQVIEDSPYKYKFY